MVHKRKEGNVVAVYIKERMKCGGGIKKKKEELKKAMVCHLRNKEPTSKGP